MPKYDLIAAENIQACCYIGICYPHRTQQTKLLLASLSALHWPCRPLQTVKTFPLANIGTQDVGLCLDFDKAKPIDGPLLILGSSQARNAGYRVDQEGALVAYIGQGAAGEGEMLECARENGWKVGKVRAVQEGGLESKWGVARRVSDHYVSNKLSSSTHSFSQLLKHRYHAHTEPLRPASHHEPIKWIEDRSSLKALQLAERGTGSISIRNCGRPIVKKRLHSHSKT